MSERKRVFLIGLDGCSFDFVEKMIGEGKLPNLSKLRQRGASGRLTSTIPTLSPPAWTSLVTGKKPGNHGILGFTQIKPNSYDMRIINSSLRRSKAIWTLLNEVGRKAGIINVTGTFPPDQVNGFMISGMPSPDRNFTYPEELYDVMVREIGEYKQDPDQFLYGYGITRETFIEEAYKVEENRERTVLYLMKNYDWDFFMTVFSSLDRIQHFFWKYLDPQHPTFDHDEAAKYCDVIPNLYQKFDEIVGNLIENLADGDTVIIASDHGFDSQRYVFHLDYWLRELELLNLKKNSIKTKLLNTGSGKVEKFLSPHSLSRFKVLNDHPKLLMTVRDSLFKNIVKKASSSYHVWNVDMSKTKAYCGNYFDIYINVKGKRPQGIVEAGKEYDEICNQIVEELYNLTHPETGEKLVDKIFRKDEIYTEHFLEEAADIIFTMKNTDRANTVLNPDSYIAPSIIRSGTHLTEQAKRNGVFFIAGPDIKSGVKIDTEIIDILPTILQIMQIPIPSDVDGRVITEAFKAPVQILKGGQAPREDAQPEYVWSKEDEEIVKEKLEGWGYLG